MDGGEGGGTFSLSQGGVNMAGINGMNGIKPLFARKHGGGRDSVLMGLGGCAEI